MVCAFIIIWKIVEVSGLQRLFQNVSDNAHNRANYEDNSRRAVTEHCKVIHIRDKVALFFSFFITTVPIANAPARSMVQTTPRIML